MRLAVTLRLALIVCLLASCGARTGLGAEASRDAEAFDSSSDSSSDVTDFGSNICPLTPPTGGSSCTPRSLDGSTQIAGPACLYAPQQLGGTAPERYFICTTGGSWGVVTNVGGDHCSDLVCHPEQAVECIEEGRVCCRACSATGAFVDCGPC
jgi:hypothetical protein